MDEEECFAAYFIEAQNVTRLDMIGKLSEIERPEDQSSDEEDEVLESSEKNSRRNEAKEKDPLQFMQLISSRKPPMVKSTLL